VTAADRLTELGIQLPDPFPAFGNYVMSVRTGDTLHVTGHVPVTAGGAVTGKLGADLTAEDGYAAARAAAICLLGTLQGELGSLERVGRLVYLHATINAAPDFTEHTAVADGASDLLVDVLGERGRHARLAVGVSSLPGDVALEIQVVVELTPDLPRT
jgi:enamine deaminase RidA (YjgF/YER057c/UK114 family)